MRVHRVVGLEDPLDRVRGEENVVARSGRLEFWSGSHAVRNREYRQLAVPKRDIPWLIENHVDPQRPEETEDAAGLTHSWSVVIARDHYDVGVGQHLDKTRELLVGVQDCRIARPDAMKDVAADQDEVGLKL